MSQQLDRAGTFRAEITDYCLLAPFKSGAIPVSLAAKLTAMWDSDAGANGEGDWVPWEEYDVQADGMQWLVKKDGTLNESTVKNLMEHAGWDGDFESLSRQTWQPVPCQVVCNEENDPKRAEYNQFPIAFVNAYDAAVGGQRAIDPAMVSQLKARHGATLRALAGNAQRNVASPKGKPADPPKKSGKAKAAVPPNEPSDEIPF